MSMPRLTHFLTLARDQTALIVDLCADPDWLSRAQLLHYLEHHGVPAAQKDDLIEALCQAAILLVEHQAGFIVNPAVVDLVNYYERRGRLISATFLRDQMLAIADLTGRLQRELFAAEVDHHAIFDVIDDLYRLVREVRQAGHDHYVACMRLLGDIKRAGGKHSLAQRLQDLEHAQRRYIEPLRELIDPSGDYVLHITQLRRQVGELGRQDVLLAQSQELDSRRRRLISDLHFIDHELLRGFAAIVDTARTLLHSLLDEKSLKDALTFCLARLDQVWLAVGTTTLIAAGRNTFHAAPMERIETFFADVVHRRLLPQPRALTISPAVQRHAEDMVLTERHLWQTIATVGTISSWPAFVTRTFPTYVEEEQLRAMVLPLLRPHPQVALELHDTLFRHELSAQTLQLRDFGVRWEERYAR
ncbi:hypothetical protein EYB53_010775 [Candidatus Chloroploca sp. M-50]|uniref:Uncharacterized protein n=1 Tax=Candidatus Chloroploca mongolica TaxID=2528176 RepID=A0ABS4D9R4_9CHLR|nr:hypothetical protein [Candidatus Chloroploca mongolica]MBP1466189.1 hypothetical protein [Candidatus Chloroploca mongolica]